MCSFFRPFVALLAILFAFPSYSMVFTGQTLISPDGTRHAALLGHHHKQTGWDHEGRQIDELIEICKEGVKEGKKFHILYEKIGPLARFLLPQRSMLGDIEQDFAKAQVPNCTFENIEIRDASGVAWEIFQFKGKVLSPKIALKNSSKTLDELTFQDVFDEFEKYAGELEQFAVKTVEKHADYQNVWRVQFKYNDARWHIDKIKEFLQENNLNENSKILELALERKDYCDWLHRQTDSAFSHLLELHMLRRLLQVDSQICPIVIAGAWHTQELYRLLEDVRWQLRFYESNIYVEIPQPFDYRMLRSLVLNESFWDSPTKTTFAYWVALKKAFAVQYQEAREAILARYCK